MKNLRKDTAQIPPVAVKKGRTRARNVTRDTLLARLDHELEPQRFRDYCPNGLQVEGTSAIARVVTGVTASMALLRAAVAAGAQAVLVHHGYFWKGEDPRVLGARKERLKLLLDHDLNLFAYHLPLDVHPVLGNNAQLGKVMGWTMSGRAGENDLIAYADLAKPTTTEALGRLLLHRLDREPLAVGNLQRPIRRIAWCTGAAQDFLQEAIDLGADAYVSGEIAERTTHLAREAGVAYFAAGHHATERFGIHALGASVCKSLGLEHVFVDDPNPV